MTTNPAASNRPAAKQAKETGRLVTNTFISLTACGGAILVFAWVAYALKVGNPNGAVDVRAAWGQLGDFIGGVTNPVLSFMGLIALLVTVKLQADQLNATREELDESRRAQSEAAKVVAEQLAAARQLAEAQRIAGMALASAAQSQRESADTQSRHLEVAKRSADKQAQLLERQADLANAAALAQQRAADAQEHAAQALMSQARIATLNVQLELAKARLEKAEARLESERARQSVPQYKPFLKAADEEHQAALAELSRVKTAIAAVDR